MRDHDLPAAEQWLRSAGRRARFSVPDDGGALWRIIGDDQGEIEKWSNYKTQ